MKIALAQMKMSEDTQVNYEKSLEFIRRASNCGVDLVLFPEIQLNRFFPQYSKLNKDDYSITMDSDYFMESVRNAEKMTSMQFLIFTLKKMAMNRICVYSLTIMVK